MYETISEEQIEFLEHLYDPTSMTENLIPEHFNAPQTWSSECQCIYLRPYQFGMQNYSYMYADDPDISKKQNFRNKKGAGDAYHIGARNLGKSFFLKIDVLLSYVHKIIEGCTASFDAKHLKNITEPIASFITSHKFLKLFHLRDSRKKTVLRSPLTVISEHGALIKSVNEKVEGNEPGVGFHSLHFETLWYEEASYMSDEGTKKRIDSGSSLGNIERLSGIPDLCIGSPLTKILNNKKLKNWVWRLPQYVREDWDEETEQEKIDEYGGKNSASYKLNVEAEVLEGAYGYFDMRRLKENSVNMKKHIKFFEIDKDTFNDFENRIIVDRLQGADQVYLCADIGGGSAPTEIIIVFRIGNKYKYVYNISLFRLIQKEQAQIFKYLYDKLGGAFISIDSTHDNGVTIDYLYDFGVPQKHLLKVKFNENIDVDFEKDKHDNAITDRSGDPVMKQANTEYWSFSELDKIMYEGNMEIPLDPKFLTQFNGIICKQIGTKKKFDSRCANHLVQAWQVFAICRFFNESNPMKNQKRTKRGFGAF